MSHQETKTKRKILLKRKQYKQKQNQDWKTLNIDCYSSRNSESCMKPSRLSCKNLDFKNYCYQTDRFSHSVASSRVYDSTLRRIDIKRDSQSTIQPMDSFITRITNPNSKRIKVGLPYTNLNLIGDNWWMKYEGECHGSSKHGYGRWFMSNGEQFEGNFYCDKANGKGVYYRNNQPPIQGVWKNNLLIQRN